MQPSVASGVAAPRGVVLPLAFTRSRPLEAAGIRASCSTCRQRDLCLPRGTDAADSKPFDELVYTRRRVQTGEHLLRAGDPFRALYAFRLGFFKSYVTTSDGRTQITGFPMAGDLAGMDGMGSERHAQSVVALETGEVCVLPYLSLRELACRFPALQHQINRVMGSEIVRGQRMMTLLATMPAEAKVADFLLSLSRRLAARGYSASEFHLRMSRLDIASYLGLKLETVSRTISKLNRIGAIRANMRHVAILDRGLLSAMTLDEANALAVEGAHR
jgi:CRP/FNR family transcriptional regulator